MGGMRDAYVETGEVVRKSDCFTGIMACRQVIRAMVKVWQVW